MAGKTVETAAAVYMGAGALYGLGQAGYGFSGAAWRGDLNTPDGLQAVKGLAHQIFVAPMTFAVFSPALKRLIGFAPTNPPAAATGGNFLQREFPNLSRAVPLPGKLGYLERPIFEGKGTALQTWAGGNLDRAAVWTGAKAAGGLAQGLQWGASRLAQGKKDGHSNLASLATSAALVLKKWKSQIDNSPKIRQDDPFHVRYQNLEKTANRIIEEIASGQGASPESLNLYRTQLNLLLATGQLRDSKGNITGELNLHQKMLIEDSTLEILRNAKSREDLSLALNQLKNGKGKPLGLYPLIDAVSSSNAPKIYSKPPNTHMTLGVNMSQRINYHESGPIIIKIGYNALEVRSFADIPKERRAGLNPGVGFFIIDPYDSQGFKGLRNGEAVVIGRKSPHRFKLGFMVSRYHLQITRRGDEITIGDLGSKNGTKIEFFK